MKKIAVMVILRCGEKYMLLERKKSPNAGKFVPVGGKLEAYESPVEAAVRETLEDTGIAIADPVFCGILSETSPIDYNWLCLHIFSPPKTTNTSATLPTFTPKTNYQYNQSPTHGLHHRRRPHPHRQLRRQLGARTHRRPRRARPSETSGTPPRP